MDDGALIELTCESSGARLRLGGRACVPAAERLLKAAREAAKAQGPVVVDASAVDRLDGTALQILLALQASLRAAGRELTLFQPSDAVVQTLRLTGLSAALPVRP